MNAQFAETLAYMQKWMMSFDWEPEHMTQVAQLSTRIFDQLKPLHNLGEEERFLLEAAALMHDIGFLVDESNHHKISRDMILEHEFPGVDARRKMLIALIARYHRKSIPKLEHKGFSRLDARDQDIVILLSAILRLADGLDRSHNDIVKDLECIIQSGVITIRLKTRGEYSLERYGGEKKKPLLEDVFGRKVVFEF
ncbi:HD domain-containing protein [Candidatus Sumerlaeota bacterium]|nr:HD domain-containing protein [Candidatus Sumerlaeota bacterium]